MIAAAAVVYAYSIRMTLRELASPTPREGRIMIAVVTMIATALALGGMVTGEA